MNLLSNLVGQTVQEIVGLREGSDDFHFRTVEGNVLRFCYEPDCCAQCSIVQIDGDILDLVGSPLVMCEDVSQEAPDHDIATEEGTGYHDDSYTWTFYKFATVKGYVTVRWYGSSNGYYSESVTVYYNNKSEWDYRWEARKQ